MPKAYSYLRFSTPEQSTGDSTRRQTTAAAEWCKRRGINLDKTLTFNDLGRSGFTGDNFKEGALGAFFEAVEAGVIEKGSYLVIEALDRFSRENPLAAADRLFRLVKLGIVLVTTDDGQEYSVESLSGTDPSKMLLLVIKMTQAHLESVRKSEMVGKAWRKKKALARAERKPLTRRCPEWLALENDMFVERPERVEIVRRIFRETIAGLGRREIVRRLNSEGIPPFRGGRGGWHTSSVAKIVAGRAVLGEYQPRFGTRKQSNRPPDGEPIPDYYPAIIDEQIYWRAQSAVAGRRQNAAGRHGRDGAHILRGLARCGACEAPMYIINKGSLPKGGVYLACSGNIRGTRCENSRRWRVDKLESALLASTGYIAADAFSVLDNATPAAVGRALTARARLADAESRRKRLLALVEKTDDDEAVTRFKAVAVEITALKEDLKDAEADAAKLAADPGLVQRLSDAAAFSRQLENAKAEAKRDLRIRLSEILRGIVARIDCDPDIGAIMTLKPRLTFTLRGAMPFAFRARGITITNSDDEPMPAGVAQMLLESDVSDDEIENFIGVPAYLRRRGGH